MAKRLKSRAGRKRRQAVAREPSGRVAKRARTPLQDTRPTPEIRKRREILLGSHDAQGELECILDVLAAPSRRLITSKQAEAGRRYAMAKLALQRSIGISPDPVTPSLSEWIDNGQTIGDGADDGLAAFRWRKAWLCVHDCGADVKRIMEAVCIDNQPPKTHQVTKLRIGLDALIRMWRL